MTRIPHQDVPVRFHIEVWSQDEELLHFYEQDLSLPTSNTLQDYARRMAVPLETAAFLILQPQVKRELDRNWSPYTVRVLPSSQLSWTSTA